jgi:hypothetical protein
LADDPKASLLQCPDRLGVLDTGELRHELKYYFNFADVGTLQRIVDGAKIVLNSTTDILQRFVLRYSLRPTPGQRGTPHGIAFLGFD